MEQNDIQDGELTEFKTQVKQWLAIDEEILKHESKIKELKKIKNKILQPQITTFMVNYNISDLNTEKGKIKCNERKTKKALNKVNDYYENKYKNLTILGRSSGKGFFMSELLTMAYQEVKL